jgi:hypothetical protein
MTRNSDVNDRVSGSVDDDDDNVTVLCKDNLSKEGGDEAAVVVAADKVGNNNGGGGVACGPTLGKECVGRTNGVENVLVMMAGSRLIDTGGSGGGGGGGDAKRMFCHAGN